MLSTLRLAVIAFSLVLSAPASQALEPTKENFFQLAALAMRDGQHEQAIQFLKQAIELDPRFAPAYNTLGIIYETSPAMDLKEAQRYFQMATDIDPQFVEAWNNLGRASYTKGDFKKAEKALLRSLEIAPDQPDVENTLAWVYLLGHSRGGEALKHFAKGSAGKDPAMTAYGRGLAHLIENKRFDVIEDITTLRKLKREDLAGKLEAMVKGNVKLTSQPGMPLVTGNGEERSIFAEQLRAAGGAEKVTADKKSSGIQVRLKGPLKY